MTKDNRLKILQVGSSNWSEKQEIPENMKWYYCSPGQIETLQETIEEDEIKAFTAVIVDSLDFVFFDGFLQGSLRCPNGFFKSWSVALYPFQSALFRAIRG